MTGPSLALRAYEALAPTYDAYASDGGHERWLATLEAIAQEHDPPGRRLLDVACGTGRSAAPMIARGYDVSACDLSPAMVRQAARRLADAGGYRNLAVADMRALPDWGEFDLVTCLCDAVNYLLDLDELDAAFASTAAHLRPGGLYIFDVNSLRTYRTVFSRDAAVDVGEVRFRWCGESAAETPDGIYASRLESHSATEHATSVHVQRHWPLDVIRQRLERAGLQWVTALGQADGIVMSASPDESRDIKTVVIARRATDSQSTNTGSTSSIAGRAGAARQQGGEHGHHA